MSDDKILQFFAYEHLPAKLQDISRPFGQLANWISDTLPDNPERAAAFRKLLEAKDCAVRASFYEKGNAMRNTNEATTDVSEASPVQEDDYMTSYLIFPTEQEALDRSHGGHVTDTVQKTVKERGVPEKDRKAEEAKARPGIQQTIEEKYVTQYRWATDVGKDGQTALVIDGDEQLLTQAEQAALVPSLPSGPGENWEKPGPPVNTKAPEVSQQAGRLFCTPGTWAGEPDSFSYQWQREGENVGAGTAEYAVTPEDIGKSVSCAVTAVNSLGPTLAQSNSLIVAGS